MIAKEKYLEKTEIKVKNILSELYESESETQNEIMHTKEKLNGKITELKSHYSELLNDRKELQEKFNALKSAGDAEWENAQKNFEMLLEYLDGDKESFISKAESLIHELGEKISEMEGKAVDASVELKKEISEKVKDLNISKHELQEKVDTIKNDSSDRWREIKHWFIEKSNSVKDYMSSF